MMLRRKRWRALRRRPGQSLALALVLGLGVAAFTLEVLAVTVIGLVPGAPLDWWAAGGAMRDFPDFIPAGIGLYPDVLAVVVVAATLTMLLASWPAVREPAHSDLAAVVRERA